MSAVFAPTTDFARARADERAGSNTAIAAEGVVQRFGSKLVLDEVSLAVPAGSVHALLGPNGAGKTTLTRILGAVRILGTPAGSSREFRSLIGLVPSGDRSFYLRISGLENLVFFARLHGFAKREAIRRALEVLEEVGLADAAKTRVGFYSHGMQKRLSVARALLAAPPILLVDEATHDLDPEGARRVRELVLASASRGTAVVWATQRLDEIRGLADRVTLIAKGRTAFAGSVPELMGHAVPRRYLLRLRNGRPESDSVAAAGQIALGSLARLEPADESASNHYLLALEQDVVLGDALAALTRADIDVLTCREERSEIEEAFLSLTEAKP